jgi:hypothetical protein
MADILKEVNIMDKIERKCGLCGRKATRCSKRYGIRNDGSEFESYNLSCQDCYLICDVGVYPLYCKDGHKTMVTVEDYYSYDIEKFHCAICRKVCKAPERIDKMKG